MHHVDGRVLRSLGSEEKGTKERLGVYIWSEVGCSTVDRLKLQL